MPVAARYIPSQSPRPTTFVSPATTATPQSRAALGQCIDHAAQQRDLQAFFEEYAQGHEARHGAAHRQIVDGAVNGQRTDVAAGELERLDRESVGRHDEFSIGGNRQRDRVGAGVELRVGERGREQLLDQLAHHAAAVAVRQADMRVAKLKRAPSRVGFGPIGLQAAASMS